MIYSKEELIQKKFAAERILKTNNKISLEQQKQLLKLIKYVDEQISISPSTIVTKPLPKSSTYSATAKPVWNEDMLPEIDFTTRIRLLESIKFEVKQSLKSPISAIFCDPEELEIFPWPNNKGITVKGFFHSQNSYGAMLKSTFSFDFKNEHGEFIRVGKSYSTQAAEKHMIKSFGIWVYAIISTIALFIFFFCFNRIFLGL